MRTLLIDGDVPCHMHAYGNTQHFDFNGDDDQAEAIDPDKARADVDFEMGKLMELLNADHALVALSDDRNWRYKVLPSYKHNREDSERPTLHEVIRQHLVDEYDTVLYPRLEGDDVMGLIQTDPERPFGETVIVSIDKDMRTIPGLLFRPHKDDTKPIRVTLDEADEYHLYQTLMGDTTDGYKGCPKVGEKKAAEILEAPWLEVPYEHEFKRGPRKGLTETRYTREPTDDIWAAIVSHYAKGGQTEDDALAQARVARILRHGEYDHQTNEVHVWNPS